MTDTAEKDAPVDLVEITSAAATIDTEPWGQTADGPVERHTLANGNGIRVRILTYGGVVQSIETPDRTGQVDNVALGYDCLDGYLASDAYFGCIAGRYANRIAGGEFTLDGRAWHTPVNDGPNCLHGGDIGFDKHVWKATPFRDAQSVGLVLSHLSPHGDQGFPGTLSTTVRYTLTADNALRVDYRATTDQPTVVNLTNHTYVNLAGAQSSSVDDHQVWLNADYYTPVGPTMIPTGEIAPVLGTPLDFCSPRTVGERIGESHTQLAYGQGYDHNFVINRAGDGLMIAARVVDPRSGRVMAVHTDQPGVQLYTGNHLTPPHTARAGLALETQHFPDSPNQPAFPSTVLRPGDVYRTCTVYRFGAGD